MPISADWFVVMTKTKMELEARDHLQRQQYEVYLPMWTELKRRRGKWLPISSPMFPRYLFLRPTYSGQMLTPVQSTRAVSHLVRFGSQAAVASERLVADISKFEALHNSSTDILIPFKKGETVEVLDGPFKGSSAEVLACNQQRVMLLLRLLGKAQHLEFDTAVCRAV